MMLDRIEIKEKTRQRENDGVKTAIYDWLSRNLEPKKYICYKNWGGGFGKAGRPDIEVTYKGLVNYWELKDERGVLSPLQSAVIEQYANAGKKVYVADSLEQFLEQWNKIYK